MTTETTVIAISEETLADIAARLSALEGASLILADACDALLLGIELITENLEALEARIAT